MGSSRSGISVGNPSRPGYTGHRQGYRYVYNPGSENPEGRYVRDNNEGGENPEGRRKQVNEGGKNPGTVSKGIGKYSPPSKPLPKPKPKTVVKPKPVVIPKVTSPTTAEVSQSQSTDADADKYDSRKTKKKGRSMTILTSSKGLDDKYTLGKPTLLGS